MPPMNWMNKTPLWEGEDETGTGTPPLEGTPPAADPAPVEETPGEGPKDLITDGATPKEAEEPGPQFGLEEVAADALTVPEGLEIDETLQEELLSAVNTAESRVDLANKMLGLQEKALIKAGEALGAEVTRTMAEWQDEVKTSTEYGGEKLDQSLAHAKEMATKFGGEEILEFFHATGVGNSIHMVRLLNNVYAALPQEGQPASGNPAPSGEKPLADRLFSP